MKPNKFFGICEIIIFPLLFPIGYIMMKLNITRFQKFNSDKEVFNDYCEFVRWELTGK